LLGFGREGRSTYSLIRKLFPNKTIAVIDENDNVRNDVIFKNDPNLIFITGIDCMLQIDSFDFAVKSPGIPSNSLPNELKRVQITSQTDIFLQFYGKQVIGITGTKGKSTTSSLIFHILKKAGRKTLFVGNIGIPPFDCIDEITPESVIVMELSSHQLEYVTHSPHIAILLNIFQEHLDHYNSYKEYQLAKLNIAKYQDKDDYFIYNSDNETLKQIIQENPLSEQQLLPFSLDQETHVAISLTDNWIEMKTGIKNIKLYDISNGQPLQGHHNFYNIMAAATACYYRGVSPEIISSGIRSFKGLEHRIEPVGEFSGIQWYNDSIATIPEATIEAVKTLQIVDTLILGGFDRGIDYHVLYTYLNSSEISNIIFIGEAGNRMMNELQIYGINKLNLYKVADYKQVVALASEITAKGKICLLSPAAASYDMFRNFEERGNVYKKNVRELSPSHK
jgi:UDP-N-acetylmuramoylalanine--D-glutamate ligase